MRGIKDVRNPDANWASEEVVVPTASVRQFLPDLEIAPALPDDLIPPENWGGKWYHGCGATESPSDSPCEDCNLAVRIAPDGSARFVSIPDEPGCYEVSCLAQFDWEWGGGSNYEHWFDDSARVLAKASSWREDYVSRSGLTGNISLIVAYKRHVSVSSQRDCGGESDGWSVTYDPVTEYRFYHDRYVVGRRQTPTVWLASVGQAIAISDDKQSLIEAMLSASWPEAEWPVTVCRHNPSVQAMIRLSEENVGYFGRFLCWSCRMQGLRWEEILQRNNVDRCPYVQRALKAFGESSDPLPEWVGWSSPILASHRRLVEGEKEVWELLFLRRRDGFIRRCVLLLGTDTKTAWMYPCRYIPRTLAEFEQKFGEGRMICSEEAVW